MLRKTLPGNGQAEDVVDGMGFAPGRDLGPCIMSVTTQGDPGVRPVQADTADQAADVAPDLFAGRRAGRAQDEGDRSAACGFMDMDGREAALAMKPVPEAELLLAMDSIERVVDVQHDGVRWSVMAGAVDIDQLPAHPDQGPDARRVLPSVARQAIA